MPDLYRAARSGEPLLLRAPDSTRPWQHVLDPLAGYLLFLEALAAGPDVPRALNFGPASGESMKVGELATVISERDGRFGRMGAGSGRPSARGTGFVPQFVAGAAKPRLGAAAFFAGGGRLDRALVWCLRGWRPGAAPVRAANRRL